MSRGKIIAIANQKGGVGKTTSAYNLASSLVMSDKKVLLVDLDQQGNLTYLLGNKEPDAVTNTIADLMAMSIQDESYEIHDYIHQYEISLHNTNSDDGVKGLHNIDYIPCNVLMSMVEMSLVNALSREKILKYILDEVKDEYDFIILDCGPSLGMITINALVAADSVLIPLQAEKFASLGLDLLIRNIMRVNRRINPDLELEGILFVSVPSGQIEAKNTMYEVKEQYGKDIKIFDYEIPRLTEVAKANRKQIPINCYEDKTRGLKQGQSVAAHLYNQLAQEVAS